MTISRAFFVHFEKPAPTLGDFMSTARDWLDGHKIQPISFRTSWQEDSVGIDIRFQNEDEARQFEQAFA
jgi:hypothetical protein